MDDSDEDFSINGKLAEEEESSFSYQSENTPKAA